jgi:Rod binding domain-containing protein
MDGIKGLGKLANISEVKVPEKPLPLNQDPKAAAEQFEGILVQEMLKSMWSTVPKEGLLTGSHEESMYRDLFNEALSKSISEGQGMGIKEVILKDLNALSKKK